MKKLFYILLFILSFLFYWGTGQGIENRTEAEDVYEYALMTEQGAEHAWFYHKHHLLYGPFMSASYKLAQGVGYSGRAIGVMRLISALSASGTLFFFFLFCYKRYSLRPVSSLLATLFLGVCYGFWRYSAESEIPLLASFLVMVALYYSTEEGTQKYALALSVLFSVAAVLIHIMNAVAVFVAIPVFYLIRRRFRAVLLHTVLASLFVAGTYGILARSGDLYGAGGAQFSMIRLGDVVKGCIAFIQCIISSDFVMGFRSVRAFLGELFAGRMLLEEFYFGSRLPRLHVLFSALTYSLFFALLLACLGRAFWLWKNLAQERERYHLPQGLRSLISPALFFLGYGLLLLFIEPGNPELWVMGLIPFALFFCGTVLLPLTVDNRLWIPFLMVVVLFVHNGAAMRMLCDADKDYQYNKALQVLKHADHQDLVITAGNPVFERYLRYHFEGRVLYLYKLSKEELAEGFIPEAEGKVYILGDVFNQPKSLTVRFPGQTRDITLFADRIREQTILIEDDEFGGIYRFQKESGI